MACLTRVIDTRRGQSFRTWYVCTPVMPRIGRMRRRGCLNYADCEDTAGNRWHIDCFRCNTCGTLLDSDANLLLLGDGSLICNNCTYSCSACNNKIEDLAILTGEQAFCSGCFRCRNCKRKIENLRYARTSQGIFCMSCHESIVTRRRKRMRTPKHAPASAQPGHDKALPSLPPGVATQSAFTPDGETPPVETYQENAKTQAEAPGQRHASSRTRGTSNANHKHDVSPLAEDQHRGGFSYDQSWASQRTDSTQMDPCYRQAHTVRIDRPPSPALTTTTIPSVGSCPWRSTLLPYKLRRNRKRPSPENRYQEPQKSAHHRTRRRRISLHETTSGLTEDSPRSRLRGSLRKSNDRKPMLPRDLFRRNANRIGTVRRASRNQALIYYIKRRVAIESAIPRGVRHL